MVQYATQGELEVLKARIVALENEESREAKEGTIRAGTKRGPKKNKE